MVPGPVTARHARVSHGPASCGLPRSRHAHTPTAHTHTPPPPGRPAPPRRAGRLLLEFAPASGPRAYDWGQKISLAMSATELGAIFAAPDAAHEFFHDPVRAPGGGGLRGKQS